MRDFFHPKISLWRFQSTRNIWKFPFSLNMIKSQTSIPSADWVVNISIRNHKRSLEIRGLITTSSSTWVLYIMRMTIALPQHRITFGFYACVSSLLFLHRSVNKFRIFRTTTMTQPKILEEKRNIGKENLKYFRQYNTLEKLNSKQGML